MSIIQSPDIAYHISKFLQHRDYCSWRLTISSLQQYDLLSDIIYIRKRRKVKNIYCLYRNDEEAKRYFIERGLIIDERFMKWFRNNKLSIFNFHRVTENEFRSYNLHCNEGIVILHNETSQYIIHYRNHITSNNSNNWIFTLTVDNGLIYTYVGSLFKEGIIRLEGTRYSLMTLNKNITYMRDGQYIKIIGCS